MHPVTRTPLVCAAAAAAIALLGACGAEGPADRQAAPLPSATSTATGSASPATAPGPAAAPTPTAPALPRPTFEATGFTEDDAIAFAGHYLAVLNYAHATGDSDAIRGISEPDCGACRDDAEVVDVARMKGITWENREIRFRSAYIEHFDPQFGEAGVQLEMDVPTGRLVNADGTTLADFQRMEFGGLMQLKFHHGRWWVWEMPR
ncbi:DUF6318 family protein [Kineococcus arenarius]|uniref:DUF6318 family protein n=1 Tax=Kineococcus sp. SYSU DK007 TaxID=3383128 RepID=UPI003D7E7A11